MDKLIIKVVDFDKTTGERTVEDNKTVEPFVPDPEMALPIEYDKSGRPKKHICKICFKAFGKSYNLKK